MRQFPRRVSLLGSTGSIGQQTLEVIRRFPDKFTIVGLAARSNVKLLAEQVAEFRPSIVACGAATLPPELSQALSGVEGLTAVATHPEADIVLAATSGLIGLGPTLAAIRAGKHIALANKETLVLGGKLVMDEAKRHGVRVLPVDSEHSALWQCLWGEQTSRVSRLILTASGGPFRTKTRDQMKAVTAKDALAHPTWNMGQKVTIDSATLMNKGLEAIEAHWLFEMPYSQIEAVIHPESIIHSLVEFVDGSTKAQLSLPDMRLPIQVALSYPERLDTPAGARAPLPLDTLGKLTFEPLDAARFPCFKLALEAGQAGGTYPCVLVGADEEVVPLFLQGRIGFLQIADIIKAVMDKHTSIANPTLDDLLETCAWARRTCREIVEHSGRVVFTS